MRRSLLPNLNYKGVGVRKASLPDAYLFSTSSPMLRPLLPTDVSEKKPVVTLSQYQRKKKPASDAGK